MLISDKRNLYQNNQDLLFLRYKKNISVPCCFPGARYCFYGVECALGLKRSFFCWQIKIYLLVPFYTGGNNSFSCPISSVHNVFIGASGPIGSSRAIGPLAPKILTNLLTLIVLGGGGSNWPWLSKSLITSNNAPRKTLEYLAR